MFCIARGLAQPGARTRTVWPGRHLAGDPRNRTSAFAYFLNLGFFCVTLYITVVYISLLHVNVKEGSGVDFMCVVLDAQTAPRPAVCWSACFVRGLLFRVLCPRPAGPRALSAAC